MLKYCRTSEAVHWAPYLVYLRELLMLIEVNPFITPVNCMWYYIKDKLVLDLDPVDPVPKYQDSQVSVLDSSSRHEVLDFQPDMNTIESRI